jgi:predicted esterase
MGAHYKIRTEKTGHYFTHGSLSKTTKYTWVCLHGYGQLAKNFIQRFEFLDPSKHFVIAPEGLNRFYFEGFSGRPAASWMTKEDRLDEIADFVLFLNLLRQKTGWDHRPDVKIIYVGFSQGVTTLLRWLNDSAPRVDHFLMWAGGLPDDISFRHRKEYFNAMDAHFFVGDQDPFFNQDIIEENKPLMDSIGLKPSIHFFSGAHIVDESTLKDWVAKNLD